MAQAEWGVDPEFFGPRHAHREGRIANRLHRLAPEPGLHLECAAGVGSLSITLARRGKTVIACDQSLRSLTVLTGRSRGADLSDAVLAVVADITQLPFVDGACASATTAETLEHLDDDQGAVNELSRVLRPGGTVVGTVPAGPAQWSDWDDWAGHLRRYARADMQRLLSGAGLEPEVTVWGWPILRLYDGIFLKRVNRRRLLHPGTVESDPALNMVSSLGRKRGLVHLVRSIFAFDRLFDGAPWGVGLLFSGRKNSL